MLAPPFPPVTSNQCLLNSHAANVADVLMREGGVLCHETTITREIELSQTSFRYTLVCSPQIGRSTVAGYHLAFGRDGHRWDFPTTAFQCSCEVIPVQPRSIRTSLPGDSTRIKFYGLPSLVLMLSNPLLPGPWPNVIALPARLSFGFVSRTGG